MNRTSRSSGLIFAWLVAAFASCATGRPAGTRNAGRAAVGSQGELPLTHAPRPTRRAIDAADLITRLYLIADDSMGGRESGTAGNVKVTDYIAREMRRLGLVPAGDSGTYFQTVPLVISRVDTTRTLSVDGVPLALGVDVLPFDRLRPAEGAPVVYGGMLGGGPAMAPAAAEGKIVVFTVPTATDGRRDWRFFNLGSLASYSAAAAVAVVVLDVVPTANAARLRGPRMGLRADTALRAPPPTLLVTPESARRLLGVPTLDGLAAGTAGRVATGSLGFVESAPEFPARNVVGILPGRDPALRGEYVALGAHNDHLGLAPRPLDHDSVEAFNRVLRPQGAQDSVRVPLPEQRQRIEQLRDSLRHAHGGARADSVFNGADDDGSGTAALLEIMEAFAEATASGGRHPRRSLLFVSHTGEEKGLLGSDYFTGHPTVARDSIVAQLNMDMVGRGKPTDAMGRGPNSIQLIGSRRLSTELGALIDSLNAVRTPRMDIDYTFDAPLHPLNRYCRSDHYMYARFGIPITYFSLGYHTDYHQVTDEAQYIDYAHMERVARFVHDVAHAVAERPARLLVDKPKPDPRAGCRQ